MAAVESQVMPAHYSHVISAWAQLDMLLINEAFVLHHKTIEEYLSYPMNYVTKLIMR